MGGVTGMFPVASSILLRRTIICVLCAGLSAAGELQAAIYYVACESGNDAHEGLSEAEAWQSAGKVSTFDFQDGDRVRFKRGCTWEDVSIKISRSLTFEAYGPAVAPPRLMAAARKRSWSKPFAKGLVFTKAGIAPGSPSPKEILIVRDEKHSRFYERVHALALLDSAGQFFHDVAAGTLYVIPIAGVDLQQDLYISSKPHVLEFQPVNVERVMVDGLHLSFANQYAIGFWYQSSGAMNGSLKIENCTFTGNAYQAIHIGGTNTFKDVEILNNTITANGHEGIYIGYVKGKEEGEVVTGMLRISGNMIGGLGFGWRSEGLGSAANGDGIDIKKGVAAAVIDHNTIVDVNGSYGIGAQTSNVLIENNTIRDVHMSGATADSSIAGIFVDAYDNKGPTVVRGNTVTTPAANGVVIRGNAERKPRVEIYDNEIAVGDLYFPFAFTSQNVTNTLIRNNRARGGQAGLAVLKPCCPPAGVEFRDNIVRDVSSPLVSAQDVSAGVLVQSNVFCLKSPVDARLRTILPNNIFSSDCGGIPSEQKHLHVR